jgi:hypothetical protein
MRITLKKAGPFCARKFQSISAESAFLTAAERTLNDAFADWRD